MFDFDKIFLNAFIKLKQELVPASIPDWSLPFEPICDPMISLWVLFLAREKT